MGVPIAGAKTLVFLVVVSGCMCCGCLKKVRDKLPEIIGKISINFNESDGKLTIRGQNLDSCLLITALGNIKKNFELIIEDHGTIDQMEEKQILVPGTIDQMEEKQILVHEKEDQMEEKQILVHEKEDQMEEKQIVVHGTIDQMEEKQILVHEKEDHSVVVGALSALSIASPSYSKLHHEHELVLQRFEKRFPCDGCKEEGFGTRYRCKHCDYELHKDCMNPKPTISHDLFEGFIFKFSHEKPSCSSLCRIHTKSCKLCGNEIHGYSYHCNDMDSYLHPSCANFTKNLCIQGENFVLKNKATMKCFWCNESEIKTNSGWSYVSESKKVQLHINCMANIGHEVWKEGTNGGGDDAYILVIQKRLHSGIVKNTERKWWSSSSKLLKMIAVCVRTVIGILLGDPTGIIVSMLVEVIKK